MRILHFSDPHFDLSLRRLPFKKWFGKRAIGALNLLAGRGRVFDQAEEKGKFEIAVNRRQRREPCTCVFGNCTKTLMKGLLDL